MIKLSSFELFRMYKKHNGIKEIGDFTVPWKTLEEFGESIGGTWTDDKRLILSGQDEVAYRLKYRL